MRGAFADPYKHEAVSRSHVLEAGRGQMRLDRLDKLCRSAQECERDRRFAHAHASILTYSSRCFFVLKGAEGPVLQASYNDRQCRTAAVIRKRF